MKLTRLPSEFQEALPILKKIKDAGYKAYFVGGGVRDILLDRPIHDVDIATSSYPQETKSIFSRTVDIGLEHGTVLVLENGKEYEITTFRTEEAYVDYRRPSQVSFVRSLDEDLKRRDFTVNALALDENGQVIDHFNGLEDLKVKKLRAVGRAEERFEEDALRIMRGFRFAASLDFDIEEKTFLAMCSHAHLLEKISVERSFIEFDKLLTADNWKLGLGKLIEAAAYDYLPGLKGQAIGLNRLIHSIMPSFSFKRSEQAWAALILEIKVSNVKLFLKGWKTSNDFQKMVNQILSFYKIRKERKVTSWDLYYYGFEVAMLSEELRRAHALDYDFEALKAIYNSLTIYDKHDIVVNGSYLIKELGCKPGPHLGYLLNQIEVAIVMGELENDRLAIKNYLLKELDNG
ncbi:CCA tRNA nucleotidyltransferase [Streptococcus didelphis]|uniref:CCA-adding enzyme n=1 Tax=Streptococcus didelphis TaxID=102886 RepID=A0ABY9LHI8_9STRE|nr:CCA tRNA nucleotidyltransferase [Streptococcus didelphis]WMB28325.1 CCA tRNA nucleotidyltransferase [Streptococcus didelphis]